MAGETVVGVFNRADLSPVLVRVHQRRLGAQVRVLDAARGALARQLAHAGLPIEPGPEATALGGDAAIVLISAPGRQDEVARLFHDLGAKRVSIQQPVARPLFTYPGTRRAPVPSRADPTRLPPEPRAEADSAASS